MDSTRAARTADPGGLREALEQALDRMESMWALMNPPWSDDECHGIAQACWFGMEEVRAALASETTAPDPWVPPTPADLDALLIEWWPLQRDEYVAYIVARAASETTAPDPEP